MFGLLINKIFLFFFVARAFHVCFMHLTDVTALIVSNVVLIAIKICEIENYVSRSVKYLLQVSQASVSGSLARVLLLFFYQEVITFARIFWLGIGAD